MVLKYAKFEIMFQVQFHIYLKIYNILTIFLTGLSNCFYLKLFNSYYYFLHLHQIEKRDQCFSPERK